jgi:hypothetical protein
LGIVTAQAEALSNRLPSYFVFALNKEWRRHPQDYGRISEHVKTPFTQADKRERGWLLYNAWLQKQIQEPMECDLANRLALASCADDCPSVRAICQYARTLCQYTQTICQYV